MTPPRLSARNALMCALCLWYTATFIWICADIATSVLVGRWTGAAMLIAIQSAVLASYRFGLPARDRERAREYRVGMRRNLRDALRFGRKGWRGTALWCLGIVATDALVWWTLPWTYPCWIAVGVKGRVLKAHSHPLLKRLDPIIDTTN